ncbi:MAG: hypothetical protein KF729_32305 [Sandaracinaceae bacterium]|nr:hypothetical protein [Sandaracinaceae bacterium]
MTRAVVVALLALGALGCARGPALGAARTGTAPRPMDAGAMRVAILEGLAARGFVPEGEAPGDLVARLATGTLRVRIRYDGARYQLTHEPSFHRERPGPEYASHADALRAQIDAQLAGAASRAAPPPAYGVTAPATSAPSAYGMAAPVASTPPLVVRSTRPFWELAIPGMAVFAGTWVANFSTSLALNRGDSLAGQYVGLSFVPLGGPFGQLPTLQWDSVPRWTGIFHPVMGFSQIAGLVVMIVGLAVQVPDAEPQRAAGLRFDVSPVEGGAVAGLGGAF